MTRARKLLDKVKKKVEAVAYGHPLYRKVLESGPVPEGLRLILADPWPGNSAAGEALMQKPLTLFSEAGAVPWAQRRSLAAHSWLRDLRAVGTEAARKKAVALIDAWLQGHDEWREESWAPDVLGERLYHWMTFHDFYAPAASAESNARLIPSMVRQLRHLLHALPSTPTGIEGISAIKGLVYGGLGLIEGEKSLGLALELLKRQISAEILPDGGHISRNPQTAVRFLKGLIEIRAALCAARYEVPSEVTTAITKLVPAIKLFRHGDGGLALFHGAFEGQPLLMDALLTLSEAKGRVLRRLPIMGYERVMAGRSLLLVDVETPPSSPHDGVAHAGLCAFEFSVGRERLLVNCGPGPEPVGPWRTAMAATAAHNTLTLEDCNACDIKADGGLGRLAKSEAQRYEQADAHYVEMAHDGYERSHKTLYRRALRLSQDGDELRGEEKLSGLGGLRFAVRWHLHPSVEAALLQGGKAALIRTPSGSGWRLRVEGAELALEPSLYGGAGAPRKTLQLVAYGATARGLTSLVWFLSREKKG